MPDSHNTSEPAPQFSAGECKERNPHGGLVCRRPRRHAGGHVDTNGLYWQRRDSDLDAALVPPAPYRMPVDATCWADPLSRTERRVVAAMLAAHCKRFYNAGTTAQDGRRGTDRQVVHALICTSAEMSDLHLDVTERAEVAL